MIQLDLNPEEKEILADAIESYLSDLQLEIADTDRKDAREYLKQRRQVLLKTLGALGRPHGGQRQL
jgi:hypothetical protein